MQTEIRVPDIGSTGEVDVIEVLINPGDTVNLDDSLITLESDKASMEIPATQGGKVVSVKVKVGDKVSQGDVIALVDAEEGEATQAAPEPATQKKTAKQTLNETAKQTLNETTRSSEPAPAKTTAAPEIIPVKAEAALSNKDVYAGPGVRRSARELGIDLSLIQGSGPKGRILKEDLYSFVKGRMSGSGGFSLPTPKTIDFSQFGTISTKPLNKIKKITGQHTHAAWVSIPHVTQFDSADITELEAFRKAQKQHATEKGVRLTALVFVMKAVVRALKTFPQFNASLDPSGENLILKDYFNIGVAVDTPNGLVVPVIRDVDSKGIFEIAQELGAISQKAREKGLMPSQMQGGCFTISSLGGIGGTAFTPIVNAPEVAILGLSRASMQPVYQDNQFEPRLIMPFSLSYDHRVIDGAEAARFTQCIAHALNDIRTLLL